MTKEVYIKIKGEQLGEDEEPIIITAPGSYHMVNGKHYIHYEENIEGSDDITKNTLKISADRVIILKRGVQDSQMIFDLKEREQAIYHTTFGTLTFDTDTKWIRIRESNHLIEVVMEYSLSTDGSKLSQNRLTIFIVERVE